MANHIFLYSINIFCFQGGIGEASEDVTQIVKVMGVGGQKWTWLTEHLVEFTSAGSVLVKKLDLFY